MKKVKELKRGEFFRHPSTGAACLAIESHMMMGETPYVVLSGSDRGSTEHFGGDDGPSDDTEVAVGRGDLESTIRFLETLLAKAGDEESEHHLTVAIDVLTEQSVLEN